MPGRRDFTVPNGGFDTKFGISIATPIVPGAAALSWSETVTEPTIIGHLGDTPTQHTEYDVGIAPTLTEDANILLELIQAIFLGVVQGLTEFLPVSSSGHLLLAQYFLGVNKERFGLAFDASIHTGTLLAVSGFSGETFSGCRGPS